MSKKTKNWTDWDFNEKDIITFLKKTPDEEAIRSFQEIQKILESQIKIRKKIDNELEKINKNIAALKFVKMKYESNLSQVLLDIPKK